LFNWKAGVPGKEGTDWEGGTYGVALKFSDNYPGEAPSVYFDPPIFHPNIYDNGKVCLSIIGDGWKPAITLKQILMGVQDLLDNPNNDDAAQHAAFQVYSRSKAEYSKKVKAQAKKFAVV
jgi:ubiquitin-conjugating enzyme E2 I